MEVLKCCFLKPTHLKMREVVAAGEPLVADGARLGVGDLLKGGVPVGVGLLPVRLEVLGVEGDAALAALHHDPLRVLRVSPTGDGGRDLVRRLPFLHGLLLHLDRFLLLFFHFLTDDVPHELPVLADDLPAAVGGGCVDGGGEVVGADGAVREERLQAHLGDDVLPRLCRAGLLGKAASHNDRPARGLSRRLLFLLRLLDVNAPLVLPGLLSWSGCEFGTFFIFVLESQRLYRVVRLVAENVLLTSDCDILPTNRAAGQLQ